MIGDTVIGDGSGDDVILSGEGNDENVGDTHNGQGSGNDIIVSGEGDGQSTGNAGRDIFFCGEGQDTVTDYNEAEGDIATPDCENI
jgi:Ca2+-binding RTX toxin-like protein